MKTLNKTLVVYLTLIILLMACSKDDNTKTTTKDSIEATLISSKEAYKIAKNGEWVLITEVEYNNLASNLKNVSNIGTTDEEYNDTSEIFDTASDITLSNFTTATIPEDSYVFAFKYYSFEADNIFRSKVKQSVTNISEGYIDLGGNLPKHSGEDKEVFFVLKKNTSKTTNLGYLAFYSSVNAEIGGKSIPGKTVYFAIGDKNYDLIKEEEENFVILYQGLSTTQIQW